MTRRQRAALALVERAARLLGPDVSLRVSRLEVTVAPAQSAEVAFGPSLESAMEHALRTWGAAAGLRCAPPFALCKPAGPP